MRQILSLTVVVVLYCTSFGSSERQGFSVKAGISGLSSMGLLFQNPIRRAFKNVSDHYSEHHKSLEPKPVIQLQNNNSADSKNLYKHI